MPFYQLKSHVTIQLGISLPFCVASDRMVLLKRRVKEHTMYFTYILQHIYYATAPRSVIVLPARAA